MKNKFSLVKILTIAIQKGIVRTLIMWLLIISLIPFTVVSTISYLQSRDSLINSIIEAQQTTIALKTAFINNWFSYRFSDLESQSTNLENIHLLEKLNEDFQASGREIGDYVESYRWASIVNELSVDLKAFIKIYGYYDILLISLEGNILFTAKGESDLGTNLFNGPYSGTLFAHSFEQSLETGLQIFSDFELYAPSNNTATGFLTAPIADENGEKIGVIALQISIDRIDMIMHNKIGLGKTGETYLIGPDFTLRSNSAKYEEEKILITMVDTKQTRKWYEEHITMEISSNSEIGFIYRNHRGKNVLGTHSLIEIAGVKWGLLTEKEVTEAFAPISRQRLIAIILGIATFLMVFILALVLSWRIVSPLLELTAVAEKIRAGKRNVRAELTTGNEIGILAHTFNLMLDTIKETLGDIENARDNMDGILKSITDGLIVTDNHNRVVLMNRIAEDMLNVRFSEVIERQIDSTINVKRLRELVQNT